MCVRAFVRVCMYFFVGVGGCAYVRAWACLTYWLNVCLSFYPSVFLWFSCHKANRRNIHWIITFLVLSHRRVGSMRSEDPTVCVSVLRASRENPVHAITMVSKALCLIRQFKIIMVSNVLILYIFFTTKVTKTRKRLLACGTMWKSSVRRKSVGEQGLSLLEKVVMLYNQVFFTTNTTVKL